MRKVAGVWARRVAGIALGVVTAVVEVAFLVLATGVLQLPGARSVVAQAAARLAEVERRRLGALVGDVGPEIDPAGIAPNRAMRYLWARVPVGLLGGLVLAVLLIGVVVSTTVLWSWAFGQPWVLEDPPTAMISGTAVAYYTLPGVVLLYLNLAGLFAVAEWERVLWRRSFGPSREQLLADRVDRLTTARADIVAAVDDERRRIERDLHDGIQQRLVALAMLIGRAVRATDAQRSATLLAQAHEESQRALEELREVSWRVYPTALDSDGLAAALEQVAERSPIPIHIRNTLRQELPESVRTVAYFVVCEAVTNAAKHAQPTVVEVGIAWTDGIVEVRVRDDGRGGAAPGGAGLSGLARRVAAADGRFTVDSPAGGPTEILAEIPCE